MNFKLKKKIKTHYLTKTLSKQEGLTLVSQNNENYSKYITKDLFRSVFKQNLNVKDVKFPLFVVKNNKKVSNFNILKKENVIFTKKEDLEKFNTDTLKIVQKYSNLLDSVTTLLRIIKFQTQK